MYSKPKTQKRLRDTENLAFLYFWYTKHQNKEAQTVGLTYAIVESINCMSTGNPTGPRSQKALANLLVSIVRKN